MVGLPLTRLAAAAGGLVLSVTAGIGVANADPGLDSVINSTCSYAQVMAALNAQNPAAAAKFNASPMAQSFLQSFIASPPDKRQRMANQMMAMPEAQQYLGTVSQVAGSCNNY
ncbi:MAG TPA: hemophore-related protein [Mycobacterium sp.]|nr:hemophore-related protein [Mycobacterium sp.]